MIERMLLFGASGDLTSRLLMPAVAQLAEAGELPPGFTVLGFGEHGVVGPRTSVSTSPAELEKHATVAPASRDAVVAHARLPGGRREQVPRTVGASRRGGPPEHVGLPGVAAVPAGSRCCGAGLGGAAHLGRGGDREALRQRPRLGPASSTRSCASELPRADDLPGRPLPVQRAGAPRRHAALPQPGVRARPGTPRTWSGWTSAGWRA